MDMITKELIVKLTHEEWLRAMKICEANNKQPKHDLQNVIVDDLSHFYGKASIKGEVFIASAFVDADYKEYKDSLIDVIRHEIAHLIAGISAGHNRTWQNVCKLIDCRPESCFFDDTLNPINERMFKYRLMGVLEDGSIIPVDYSNRKKKKYLQVDKTREYSFENTIVVDFYYEETTP